MGSKQPNTKSILHNILIQNKEKRQSAQVLHTTLIKFSDFILNKFLISLESKW